MSGTIVGCDAQNARAEIIAPGDTVAYFEAFPGADEGPNPDEYTLLIGQAVDQAAIGLTGTLTQLLILKAEISKVLSAAIADEQERTGLADDGEFVPRDQILAADAGGKWSTIAHWYLEGFIGPDEGLPCVARSASKVLPLEGLSFYGGEPEARVRANIDLAPATTEGWIVRADGAHRVRATMWGIFNDYGLERGGFATRADADQAHSEIDRDNLEIRTMTPAEIRDFEQATR